MTTIEDGSRRNPIAVSLMIAAFCRAGLSFGAENEFRLQCQAIGTKCADTVMPASKSGDLLPGPLYPFADRDLRRNPLVDFS
jgi:hypothetical protein